VATLLLMLARQEGVLWVNIQQLPYYVYLNGFFNVLVLIGIITLVPRVGVGTVWAAGVVGAFLTALSFDHFGVLGVAVNPLTFQKLLGAICIVFGAFFFTKRKRAASGIDLGAMTEGVAGPASVASPGWVFWKLVGLGVAIGASQTLMSTINARSGQIVGVPGAVVIYLSLGALLALFLSLTTQRAQVKSITKLPAYYLLPGVVNVLIVGLPTIFIPIVGVGVFTAVTFAAMALASMFFDRLGLLGMPKVPLVTTRVIGSVTMLAGVLILRLA
jgi:uncharacterized membrane protein YdcZ (DUF606 family)